MRKEELDLYLEAVDIIKRWRAIFIGMALIRPEPEHKNYVVDTVKAQGSFLEKVEGFKCEYFSKEGCLAYEGFTNEYCLTCVLTQPLPEGEGK